MCRLSIIVPVASPEDAFEDTLVSVLENRPSDCEVILVHSGPYADPYDLGDEISIIEVASGMTRVRAINIGIREARGEIVHLLTPGSIAVDDWVAPAMESFADVEVGSIAPLILRADDTRRILAAGLRYTPAGKRVLIGQGRSLASGHRILSHSIDGPLLNAGFYRRDALLSLNGFCGEVGDAFADADMAMSLQMLGLRSRLVPESIVRSQNAATMPPASYQRGRQAERLFWRYAKTRGWSRSLVFHGLTLALAAIGHVLQPRGYVELLGRLVSSLDMRSYRVHQARIRRAKRDWGTRAESEDDPIQQFRSPDASQETRWAA